MALRSITPRGQMFILKNAIFSEASTTLSSLERYIRQRLTHLLRPSRRTRLRQPRVASKLSTQFSHAKARTWQHSRNIQRIHRIQLALLNNVRCSSFVETKPTTGKRLSSHQRRRLFVSACQPMLLFKSPTSAVAQLIEGTMSLIVLFTDRKGHVQGCNSRSLVQTFLCPKKPKPFGFHEDLFTSRT